MEKEQFCDSNLCNTSCQQFQDSRVTKENFQNIQDLMEVGKSLTLAAAILFEKPIEKSLIDTFQSKFE